MFISGSAWSLLLSFVWPRIVLGIGLAMIFVPLTTVTLSAIPRQEMGNATGVFNLLRNIGGSVGIAIAATLLARFSQFYQTSLVPSISQYNPVFQMRFNTLKQALIAKGMQATQAEQTAMGMFYGMVRKQAAALAYNRIFFIIGLAFLAIIPLLLLKRPRHQSGAMELH